MSPPLGPLEGFLYSAWSSGPTHKDPGRYVADQDRRLDPLCRAGILSAEEAAEWRRRYAEAAADDGRRIDGLADQARALWDAAPDAVDALGIVNGPPDPGTSRVRMVRAVAASGPIDPVDAARHEQLLRRVRIMQSATGTELRRVIPGPDARADGLRIASVELYGDWGAIVWHTVGIEPRRRERRDPLSSFLDVSDDAGTDYTTSSWGFGLLTNIESRAHHDAFAYQGRERFAPAPPPNATQLTVGRAADRFSIPLD